MTTEQQTASRPDYRVVPDHVCGPAVVRSSDGVLVDNCPSVESAERIAVALNELDTTNLLWGLPAVMELRGLETERVIRALAKRVRRLRGAETA